jgi:hypothetical protein
MPTFIQRPDPFAQVIQSFVQQEQLARQQREIERARSREQQRQRQIAGAGLAAGAIGGALLAPAAVASSATTGAALTATGEAALPALLSSVGQGALAGGQIGSRFAGAPELAAGFDFAQQTVGKITQALEDREAFGFVPGAEERRAIMTDFARTPGITFSQARQRQRATGEPVLEQLERARINALDDEQMRRTLVREGLMITPPQLDELVTEKREAGVADFTRADAVNELLGDRMTTAGRIERKNAIAQLLGEKRAERQMAAVNEGYVEEVHEPLFIKQQAELDNEQGKWERGERDDEEFADFLANMPPPPTRLVKRPPPPSPEEQAAMNQAQAEAEYVTIGDKSFMPKYDKSGVRTGWDQVEEPRAGREGIIAGLPDLGEFRVGDLNEAVQAIRQTHKFTNPDDPPLSQEDALKILQDQMKEAGRLITERQAEAALQQATQRAVAEIQQGAAAAPTGAQPAAPAVVPPPAPTPQAQVDQSHAELAQLFEQTNQGAALTDQTRTRMKTLITEITTSAQSMIPMPPDVLQKLQDALAVSDAINAGRNP